MKKIDTVQNKIMRRVYYAFAIRMTTHTTTMHVVMLGVALYALGYFVHVSAVMQNMAQVPLGDFGSYALQAVLQADVMTLLVLGVIIMTTLSLPFSLPQYQRSARLQMV